jgi:hypothetical protein
MKLYNTFFVLILILPSIIFAQNKNVISTNIFQKKGLFTNSSYRINIKYERSLNNHFSLLADAEYGIYRGITDITNNEQINIYKQNGGGMTIECKYYPFTKKRFSPDGFFLGLYWKYYFLKEIYYSYAFDENHFVNGFGLNFGYKFQIKMLIIEPLIGYGNGWIKDLGSNFIISDDNRKFITNSCSYFTRIECNFGMIF